MFLPTQFSGFVKLIEGRSAVPEARASREIFTPGAIVQPLNSPSSSITRIFVAVPKSATRQGSGYFAIAATAPEIRSAPRYVLGNI